jgi:hypothetical protein
VNSQDDLKPSWPWELLSKFGNPWTDFAGFRGKALGSRTRRFASESPGNDQFSKKNLACEWQSSRVRISVKYFVFSKIMYISRCSSVRGDSIMRYSIPST